ncbi:MAG TPA: SDR family oxidoreductase [Pseudomonadales bacterium]|nr:SDR family oxidoreductase [Pseudomonadales bacterium]
MAKVLVTGAASGIGKAIVSAFVEIGADVIAADIAYAQNNDSHHRQVHLRPLDVSDENAWQAIFDWMRSTHNVPSVLVNCAGVMMPADVDATDAALFDRIMSINARGTFLGCKYFLQAMAATSTEGAVVNVASTAAIKPAPWVAAYAASKAAVVNLTRSVALQGAGMRPVVRCNAVLPGVVMTPMVQSLLDSSPDPAASLEMLKTQHPIGRLIQPEEIANAVLFLASAQASAITGASLVVDGGMTAG